MSTNNKTYKNGTTIQQDRKLGKFITTPKSILLNKDLTEYAKILFMLMVDTPSDSKISLRYYQGILGWSRNGITDSFECLRVNGYARYEKHPKGKGNGYFYTFVLSEFGNLKVEDKAEPMEDEETSTPELPKEPINETKEEFIFDYDAEIKRHLDNVKAITEEKIDGGTIAQRKETLKKMLAFFNKQLDEGILMTDDEIRKKAYVLHHVSKTANRIIDQRYND
jgi:hypothetical protein